jgi:quinol monooxygenase YgiN
MSQKKVTVVATFKAVAGMEAPLRDACLALIEPTRGEGGCINYDFHCSCDDGTLFMFYENWECKEALDKHLATPHLQAFLARVPDLVAEPAQIVLWEMLS